MSRPVWEFQYSVDAVVDAPFAWQFWTNPENWRELEPGAEFELDGPFAEGTEGRTKIAGQEARHWVIRAVDPGRSWTQEIRLPRASFLVSMRFDEVPGGSTRITQRLWLDGEGAHAFAEAVRVFEATTPDGMRRIAAAIETAKRDSLVD